MSKEIEEHVLRLYQPKKLMGSGAYGHVWKALDRRNQTPIALKKIFDAFQNSTDAQRTYRELVILTQLDHPHIVKLHRALRSKNNRDLYLVFELVQADLHSLVGENVLQTTHIRFIASQILRALKYLHSAQLLHRDLKPSNVLIDSQCRIKLCDFGLARSLTRQEQQQLILTQEVATRWYRSPEMLLGSKTYGKPTDVWSVGCILAELMIGQPLFPGDSTLNQLQKIIEFTGAPSKQSIDSLQSEYAESLVNQLSVRKRPLKDYFSGCDPSLQDLVVKMLQFSPNRRITIDQALKHPCLKQFQEEEQLCQKFIVPPVDDNVKLNVTQYRKLIYKDIERLYPEDALPSIKKEYRSAHSFTKTKHEEHATPERRQRSMIHPQHNHTPLKVRQPNVSKPVQSAKMAKPQAKPETWEGLKRVGSRKQLLRKKNVGKPLFEKK